MRPILIGLAVIMAAGAAASQPIAPGSIPDVAKDPLYRATGDHKRLYYLAAAGMATPSRVYVPADWTPARKAPLVVILHGANLTEDAAFDREPEGLKGVLKSEADKHGYILVAPLGYKGGGVGSFQGTGPTPAAQAEAAANASRGRPGGPPPPADPKDNALAEQDVISVIDAMALEYNIDRSRIYVMGNSMPGTGSWTLAIDHPEIFAAISPSAAGVFSQGYPYARLKGIGVRMVVGELDGGVALMRETAQSLHDAGIAAEEVEVKGGTHASAWYMAAPGTFDFFARYSKN